MNLTFKEPGLRTAKGGEANERKRFGVTSESKLGEEKRNGDKWKLCTVEQ